jgi:multimeric flavodoxin WrbA
MQVKILGVSGSPRKGATQYVVQKALEAASEISAVETEFIDLRGKNIHYCIHCNRCIKEKVDYCPPFRDDMHPLYEKLLQADGLIFGSPVYQMSPTALIQAFMNRFRPLGRYISKGYWASRVGGAIAVGGTRHGGQETTLESINNFFLCNGMVVVSGGIFAYNGGSIWSNDRKEAGAKEDELGLETAKVIGRRVAVTAMLLKAGLANLPMHIEPAQMAGLKDQEELEARVYKFRHR